MNYKNLLIIGWIEYWMLLREKIYDLKRGEVIAYEDERGRIQLMYVGCIEFKTRTNSITTKIT